jgi:hypothetical protein
MRPTALGLAVVLSTLLLSAAAMADRAASYGYVTHVEFPNSNAEVDTHGCTYEVALPKTLLDRAPSGPHPELLKGATEAFGADSDSEGTCDEIEHTWQRVTFDPRHREHVKITMPAETRFNFTAWFVTLSAAFLILPAVFGRRFGRWYWGRRQRRSERLARKLQAIRERIHSESPAPLPRAEVVDRGDRREE